MKNILITGMLVGLIFSLITTVLADDTVAYRVKLIENTTDGETSVTGTIVLPKISDKGEVTSRVGRYLSDDGKDYGEILIYQIAPLPDGSFIVAARFQSDRYTKLHGGLGLTIKDNQLTRGNWSVRHEKKTGTIESLKNDSP